MGTSDVAIEMARLCSSGSLSATVVPSSTRPAREIAPEHRASISTKVVLPAPAWPTKATFRIREDTNADKLHLTQCWPGGVVSCVGGAGQTSADRGFTAGQQKRRMWRLAPFGWVPGNARWVVP